MRIGLFTVILSELPFEEALDRIVKYGITAVELGVGAYPGDKHLKDVGGVEHLIEDEAARSKLLQMIHSRGLFISALSAHGNPIHPNSEIAAAHHKTFRNAVLLAEKLGVEVVNGFSGCPGGSPNDTTPNWVTCAWPDEYREILKYQWEKVAIPYWKEQDSFLKQHNVKFAIEMHPGFLVYNPETLLRLRNATGTNIGCNFDPSHLWWQGIDPLVAVRKLRDVIYNVHAKDTKIDALISHVNGNLDTKDLNDVENRSWAFRSVGYGHPEEWWRDFVTQLAMVGYDRVLSIEHEDPMMTNEEGIQKAVNLLENIVIKERRK
jgi:sugar phosphate isomerase/epimerase